jgi:hypothetical protein
MFDRRRIPKPEQLMQWRRLAMGDRERTGCRLHVHAELTHTIDAF